MKTYSVSIASPDGTTAHLRLVPDDGGGTWSSEDARSASVMGSAGGTIARWDKSGAILDVNGGTLVLSGLRKRVTPGSPDAAGVGVFWVKHSGAVLRNGDISWVCTGVRTS